MFEDLLKLVAEKSGLGAKASELLPLLLSKFQSEGISGVVEKIKSLGLDIFKGGEVPALTPDQTETVLGTDFISSSASKLGVSKEQVTEASGHFVPALLAKLAPGGVIPSASSLVAMLGGGVSVGALSGGISKVTAGVTDEESATNGLVAKLWPVFLLGALGVSAYFAFNKVGQVPLSEKSKDEIVRAETKLSEQVKAKEKVDLPAPEVAKPVAPKTGKAALDELGKKANVSGEELVKALNLCVINFETGKSVITAESKTLLTEAASVIKKAPADTKILIGGHTDNVGDATKNIALSMDRAKAVEKTLIALGCNGENFDAKGFGSSKPLVGNDSAANKAKNRRMEFTLIK
jgi:outer membrane protein OmpA-like peptidoglycan-associated protein/uncharacterized protein YidB (DUF937 family)